MNRPIKFRVWEAHNKKFSGNPFGFRLNKKWELSIPDDSFDGEVWQFIYQQFTGLLDKDGREIYEGDIVSGEFYDSEYCSMNEEIVEVVFSDGRFNISIKEWFGPSLKIIGNIFEAPELLSNNP